MATNNINKLRSTSFSQGNYTKTVAENKIEFFQDLVNDRFTYATDYTVVGEQNAVGGTLYKDIGVRVTKGISSGLSENFANEVKKIIFKDYNHEQYLGKQYKYKDKTWLTVNLNETTGASSHSLVRQCNNIIKWVNPNNSEEVLEWECVFTKQFTNANIKYGSEGLPEISGDFWILVQQNELTINIPFNQRFILDGHAFQVNQIDNHLSKTYLTFKIFETQIQPNDDLINGIAGAESLPPVNSESKILPQDKPVLIIGAVQEYTIYNYIDGVPNTDAFTIMGMKAPSSSYVLTIIDGNTFSVENIEQSAVSLIIECANIEQPLEPITMISITLGGKF